MTAYRQGIESSKTGWLETHPCDMDRIARAAIEEPGEGIFHVDGRATDVFTNFDAMAKVVSFEYYRSMLGPEMTKEQLYAVAELVESQVGNQEGQAAAARYFLGSFDPGVDAASPAVELSRAADRPPGGKACALAGTKRPRGRPPPRSEPPRRLRTSISGSSRRSQRY